ncbi:DUF2922 domain-containing protein [Enterococcus sp. AZ196]|uniref:DUF2922 domain-containing protein n=1 Tax=Enterococcus sp. AZ196 TaxID=2774659 RepID=UPI003D2AE922
MYTLDAEFEKSNGKHHHLRLKDFDPSKTAEEIKTSLEKITKLNLFEKDGVGLFKKVLHAKVIEKRETPIFDQAANEVPAAVEQQAAQETPQVSEFVETEIEKVSTDFRIPEDLSIVTERPAPDVMIQTIGFPPEINPWELNEMQSLAVITACLPDDFLLENVQIDDSQESAKLILIERLKEGCTPVPLVDQASPEEIPKKKRKRLIDRIRRRE